MKTRSSAPAPAGEALTARAERLRRIQAIVAQRSPTQRDADRQLFLTKLSRSARDDFERHGWMSALNAQAIKAFWEDLFPGLFDPADPAGQGG